MTLGRAYVDTGEWARARTEFEQVLKGAPDNILASRFLAECLENLGDAPGALARYKATLVLSPGDKFVVGRVAVLESKGKGPAAPAPPPPDAAPPLRPPSPAAEPAAEPPPIPLVAVDTPMELERPEDRAGGTGVAAPAPGALAPAAKLEETTAPPPPIPVSAAEEDFELERPYEAPSTGWSSREAAPAVAAPPPPPPAPAAEPMMEFDFEANARPAPAPPPVRIMEPVLEAEVEIEALPEAPVAPTPAAPPAAPAEPPDLTSPTLAELYFNQGFIDKAIQVYRQILEREPGNPRLEARLRELEALAKHLEGTSPAATAPAEPAVAGTAAADRRQVLERTIMRLEGFLAAIRRE
jgi:tetratricopeptide (TPR) repeat protein